MENASHLLAQAIMENFSHPLAQAEMVNYSCPLAQTIMKNPSHPIAQAIMENLHIRFERFFILRYLSPEVHFSASPISAGCNKT